MLSCIALTGCLQGKTQSNLKFQVNPNFEGNIDAGGMAFITPTMPTGREQDMQSVALLFYKVMKEQRQNITRLLSMPETVGIVNQNGMLPLYRSMYDDYNLTGLFPRSVLTELSKKLGVRYLAQLQLSSFSQRSDGRFGISGFRLLFTREANVRLFMQVWDGETGEIVWEGSEELNYSRDTPMSVQIPFRYVVERAANNLIGRLPG